MRGKVGGKEDYLRAGDQMRNAALGRTLEQIANDSYAFYNGSLANDIVADVSEQGTYLFTIRMTHSHNNE